MDARVYFPLKGKFREEKVRNAPKKRKKQLLLRNNTPLPTGDVAWVDLSVTKLVRNHMRERG